MSLRGFDSKRQAFWKAASFSEFNKLINNLKLYSVSGLAWMIFTVAAAILICKESESLRIYRMPELIARSDERDYSVDNFHCLDVPVV